MPDKLWLEWFDDRQQKEIKFAQVYADPSQGFAHGTNGHNDLMIIARMADLLSMVEIHHPEAIENVRDLLGPFNA